MKNSNFWIKAVHVAFYNAKWIFIAILALNLFVFGYWDKISESGLGDEETAWGVCIVACLILFFVFDKKWKSLCDKIFSLIEK